MIQPKWEDIYKSWSDMAVMMMIFWGNSLALSADLMRLFWGRKG